MQTERPTILKKPTALESIIPLASVRVAIALLIGMLLLINNPATAQTTCATAISFTAVNATTCSPGTSFNINSTGTGPAFTSCGTGVASPINEWGRFIANSSTARISYTPPFNRDAMIFAYDGTCPTPSQINCIDLYGNGATENLDLTGLTPGNTYYFRIVAYNRNSGNMNGNVCVASPFSISTNTISGSSFCAGAAVTVPFTSYGTFSGNTYTAQLSDASGSFSTPTNIGTLVSNANSGNISATLPGSALGTGYRIRVVSDGPSVIGTDNGTDITITGTPQGVFSGSTICSGIGTPELTFTASNGTGPFTVVYNDGVFNRTINNVSSGTPFTPVLTPIITTNYTLISVADASGCSRNAGFTDGTATITFAINPSIISVATAAEICESASSQNSTLAYSLPTGAPVNYTITWDAAALSAGLVNSGILVLGSSPAAVPVAGAVAAGTYTGTFTVFNAAGCQSSGNSFTITINPVSTISGNLSMCAGATSQLTGSGTPAALNPWVSSNTAIATVNNTGLVSGVSAGTCNITYTNSYGCSISATVTVYSFAMSATGTTICVGGSGQLTSNSVCPGGSALSTGAINAGNAVNNSATGSSAWVNPGNITTAGLPHSTQTVPANATTQFMQATGYGFAIPPNAIITGITVNINRQFSTANRMQDNIVSLVKAGTIMGDNLASATYWPNAFAVGVYGGSNQLWGTSWSPSDINHANFGVVISGTSSANIGRTATIDYIEIEVSYYIPGNLNWFTVSSGGSSIGTGTSFNPVGVPGSGLANTNTAGSTAFYAECAATPGCRAQADFVILDYPTITIDATTADACFSSIAQSTTLAYSSTSGSPSLYAINWDAAAQAAGLVNMPNTTITTSPLNVPIAANVTPGTYTGTLTVTNTGNCSSSGSNFTLTIKPSPSITADATAAAICFSNSVQLGELAFSVTTNSPITYSITWDAAAQAAGLTNLSNATMSGSPLTFNIPANTASGTHNGHLTVSSANGCSSGIVPFTQFIGVLPTITTSSTTSDMCYSAGSQVATLSYSATTGSPITYTITWNAAALAAGLVSTGSTVITSSPLSIPVAAGVPNGVYTGTIRVRNGSNCQSSPGNSFTMTISGVLPVMTSASSASICSGGTVNIPLTSNIPSTYTWIATNNSSVSGESLSMQSTSTLNNTLTITSGSTSQNVIYTVTPTSMSGCSGNPQTVTVTVNPLPTITASATAAPRCYSASAQTSTLSYSAVSGSPATYRITWNPAALAAGLSNSGNIALTSSPVSFSIPAAVAAGTYTGAINVSTSAGCVSSPSAFTLTISPVPTITSQPVSQTVCSGSSVSLSIAVTGSSLSYQWRRGTTDLCNCGNVSGVNTATLTINPIAPGDAASNYNCVVTSSGCASIISDYASITVNSAAAAPTTRPTSLVFPTVSTTSILASFTAAMDATHYLVIRKTNSTAPTNPSNGTSYTVGTSALTGTVDHAGTSDNFVSNGLTPGTTYYYWIYPYNISSCGTSPMYLTSTPLSGSVTTATNVACGTVTTLYWGGTGSVLPGAVSGTNFNTASNWSTSSSSYVASPVVPTACNDVSMALNNTATITLSGNASVYGLTFTIQGNGRTAILSTQGNTLTVNSNAVVDVLSGNNNTSIAIGENSAGAGVVDFKANFRIGETYYGWIVPTSYLVGNVNSKVIFRGDVLFGRTSRVRLPGNVGYPPSYPLAAPGTATTPGTILFDGIGLQQVLWNNNVYYDCFYNIVVGDQNSPYVKHVTGTYTPDNILNNLTINTGCTVDLGTSQWIREQAGGSLTLNGTAKLILGNYRSVTSSYGTGVVIPGSNFPGGFSTMSISPTSTIEYNGGNGITQTVYATPTYGHLILSNIDGTGTANKVSTGTVTANGTTTLKVKTQFTPGANVVINGAAIVNNEGTWVSGTTVTSGTGSFTLQNGGTLSMASTAGITASGATGNIQTATRSFGTGANYIYNGTAAQAAGSGLPTTVNNLTINNTNGVSLFAASSNYTVSNLLALTAGPLTINGNTITINNLSRNSGTLRGSATSSVAVNGNSIPLFFTSGGQILKDLTIHNSASADLQTKLDITAGSSAGSVSVGSNSTLNTFGNLTLKSNATGTARVAEIPVNGSGTALGNITGNVMIERFIPGRRAWRIITAPVQATGAQTINDAWQEGVVNTDLSNNQNPNPGFGIHISGASTSNGFDATPLNNPSMRVYNRATTSFAPIANTTTIKVRDYEGYMVFVRGNRSTDLNQNTSASLSTTVVRESGGLRMGRQSVALSASAGSYSLVGNPYPSTIDFRTVTVTGAGNAQSFVMWDPNMAGTYGVGAYQYFTQSGGPGSNYEVFPGGGSYGTAGTVNNFVQSGQAFLVPNTGAATLTINESSKSAGSTSAVFRPMPDNITGKISTILYKQEADSSYALLDGGLVMYRSEYNDEMDMYDIKKLSNSYSENFGINKDAVIYQIEKKQTINETDTIHYNMRNLNPRNYLLEIELKNIEMAGYIAYLQDNFTGNVTTLEHNQVNKFAFSPTAAEPGSYAPGRFKVFFKQMNVLPVTFTTVSAIRNKDKSMVDWKVQHQINMKQYEVERSTDAIHFTKQSNSIAATNSHTYQWVDEQPATGINYYRIKAIGNNGSSQYSNIAKLFFGKSQTGISVFPNPMVDNKTNLYITNQQAGTYTINLFNTTGQLIHTNKLALADGNSTSAIEMKKELPHGNYILEIIKPDGAKEHVNIIN